MQTIEEYKAYTKQLEDEIRTLKEALRGEQALNAALAKDNVEMGRRAKLKDCSPSFDVLAVTSVKVFPFKEGPSLGHVKGMAEVALNDQLLIRGIRVMQGENGLFVGYPVDPFFKGEDLRTLAQPVTMALREHIENCVLEKYTEATA